MPQIDFAEDFKRKGLFDYDKLTLEQNERARICVLDKPSMEYVHTLRKIITEDGQPIMETQKYGKNFDKTREVPKTDFVGKFICLGDIKELDEKGVDPENCPACQAAAENGAAVEVAKRRFVVHVLKYETKKNSFNLSTPFGAKVLAWEFAESRFSTLVDISVEHGDLSHKDLNLGPCENKTFQKYEVIPGNSCEWRDNEDNLKRAIEIIKAQKSDDLTPLLGRRVEPHELRSQVQEIVNIYHHAFGRPGALPPSPTTSSTASADIEELLSNSAAKEETKAEEAPADLSGLDEFSPAEDKSEPTNEELAEEKPKETKKSSGVEDLEDLLADLEA